MFVFITYIYNIDRLSIVFNNNPPQAVYFFKPFFVVYPSDNELHYLVIISKKSLDDRIVHMRNKQYILKVLNMVGMLQLGQEVTFPDLPSLLECCLRLILNVQTHISYMNDHRQLHHSKQGGLHHYKQVTSYSDSIYFI